MTFQVGASKYCKGGNLAYGVYADNSRLCIRVYDDQYGDQAYTATVNLDVAPQPNCVWLKGWSENEGVPEAFVKSNFGKLTGRTQTTGFVCAQEFRLDESIVHEAKESLKEQGLDVVGLL